MPWCTIATSGPNLSTRSQHASDEVGDLTTSENVYNYYQLIIINIRKI